MGTETKEEKEDGGWEGEDGVREELDVDNLCRRGERMNGKEEERHEQKKTSRKRMTKGGGGGWGSSSSSSSSSGGSYSYCCKGGGAEALEMQQYCGSSTSDELSFDERELLSFCPVRHNSPTFPYSSLSSFLSCSSQTTQIPLRRRVVGGTPRVLQDLTAAVKSASSAYEAAVTKAMTDDEKTTAMKISAVHRHLRNILNGKILAGEDLRRKGEKGEGEYIYNAEVRENGKLCDDELCNSTRKKEEKDEEREEEEEGFEGSEKMTEKRERREEGEKGSEGSHEQSEWKKRGRKGRLSVNRSDVNDSVRKNLNSSNGMITTMSIDENEVDNNVKDLLDAPYELRHEYVHSMLKDVASEVSIEALRGKLHEVHFWYLVIEGENEELKDQLVERQKERLGAEELLQSRLAETREDAEKWRLLTKQQQRELGKMETERTHWMEEKYMLFQLIEKLKSEVQQFRITTGEGKEGEKLPEHVALLKEQEALMRDVATLKVERDRLIGEAYYTKEKLKEKEAQRRELETECRVHHLPKIAFFQETVKRLRKEGKEIEQQLISIKMKYAEFAFSQLQDEFDDQQSTFNASEIAAMTPRPATFSSERFRKTTLPYISLSLFTPRLTRRQRIRPLSVAKLNSSPDVRHIAEGTESCVPSRTAMRMEGEGREKAEKSFSPEVSECSNEVLKEREIVDVQHHHVEARETTDSIDDVEESSEVLQNFIASSSSLSLVASICTNRKESNEERGDEENESYSNHSSRNSPTSSFLPSATTCSSENAAEREAAAGACTSPIRGMKSKIAGRFLETLSKSLPSRSLTHSHKSRSANFFQSECMQVAVSQNQSVIWNGQPKNNNSSHNNSKEKGEVK